MQKYVNFQTKIVKQKSIPIENVRKTSRLNKGLSILCRMAKTLRSDIYETVRYICFSKYAREKINLSQDQ